MSKRGLGPQVSAAAAPSPSLMVLVHMVAEMRGAGVSLMAAIASRRGQMDCSGMKASKKG